MAIKRSKAPPGTLVTLEHSSRVLRDYPWGDPHVRKVARCGCRRSTIKRRAIAPFATAFSPMAARPTGCDQSFALDTIFKVPPGADCDQLLAAMRGHVLAKGRLVGSYQQTIQPPK
jgi:hypothetical protein